MSNLSIFERNIIDSLGVYDNQEQCVAVFLAQIEKKGVLKAEAEANEMGVVMARFNDLLNCQRHAHSAVGSRLEAGDREELSTWVDRAVENGLVDFMRDRLWHYRNPGRQKTPFERIGVS